mgnify:CR=1 FL=1|tara:strand:+ start:384 stop:1208 length:825 start_codon:yes stop_codon:yes gene_type:complete
MKKVEFTVLMCTYYKDDPKLLESSIVSIFQNTIKPDFFILTVDGKIPNKNWEIIYKLKKIYIIQINIIKENVGLALALNNAIKLVKTEWIARADSDDINMPKRFEKQIQLAKNNFDVIGGNILEIDQNNHFLKFEKRMPETNQEIKKYLKKRNPINHMTAFYKTDLIKRVGGYPNIFHREDYGLWIKLAYQRANFYNINDILVRVNGGKSLYKRRRGFKNIPGEFKLQFLFYRLKIKPIYLSIFHFIVRIIILLLPINILEKFYQQQLRQKTNL